MNRKAAPKVFSFFLSLNSLCLCLSISLPLPVSLSNTHTQQTRKIPRSNLQTIWQVKVAYSFLMILSGLAASLAALRSRIFLSLTNSHSLATELFWFYSNHKGCRFKNAIFMSVKSLTFLLYICHCVIVYTVICLLEDSCYWMKLKWTKSKTQSWIPLAFPISPWPSPFYLLVSWQNSSLCKHAWKSMQQVLAA